jgi:SpoVK/Ycf46/Vps4 family AAA+-type ATPase
VAGRELKALIAAYRDRDDLAFRRAAQAIIDEEESKKHVALARDLRRLLASGSGLSTPIDPLSHVEPPKDRESNLPLVDVVKPSRRLEDLVLSPALFEEATDLVHEIERWADLDVAGIPRRRSLLLYGPPGCGKTSIAEAMAGELNRPLSIVRTDSVISSFLGETASNLARVFEYANSTASVVLFDEFDSLGKSRDDQSDHGELRRVVNGVLQLIDRYEGPSFLIAATNHSQVLDAALWRRFSEVQEVGFPDLTARLEVLRRNLGWRKTDEIDLDEIARDLEGYPHAAVERVAVDAARRTLLAERTHVTQDDLAESLHRVTSRPWL